MPDRGTIITVVPELETWWDRALKECVNTCLQWNSALLIHAFFRCRFFDYYFSVSSSFYLKSENSAILLFHHVSIWKLLYLSLGSMCLSKGQWRGKNLPIKIRFRKLIKGLPVPLHWLQPAILALVLLQRLLDCQTLEAICLYYLCKETAPGKFPLRICVLQTYKLFLRAHGFRSVMSVSPETIVLWWDHSLILMPAIAAILLHNQGLLYLMKIYMIPRNPINLQLKPKGRISTF